MSATAFQRMRREQVAKEVAEKADREAEEKLQKEKPIDKMTVSELKAYAETNKIDLGDATKKDDILAAIQAALAKKEAEIEQEKQLQELREKAIALGIENVDEKDTGALTKEIAAVEGEKDNASE